MKYITSKNNSRQPMFLGITGTLILLSTIAVSLRLYCRVHYIGLVGIDDHFMLLALLIAIALVIMNGIHVSWGTGQHGANLDMAIILVPTLKHWYAYQLVYPLALFSVKASILALYHRIFPQKQFRWMIYFVAGFVSIYTVVVFFVNAFECRTYPSRAWSPSFPAGCNNLPALYFSTASINILTDVAILVMPLRAFQQLHMQRRKRLALMGIFMIGGVAVLASIIRLYALWVYTTTKDVAYDAIFILLLSQIEVNIAIISASAPALRPLIDKTFKSHSQSPTQTVSDPNPQSTTHTFGPENRDGGWQERRERVRAAKVEGWRQKERRRGRGRDRKNRKLDEEQGLGIEMVDMSGAGERRGSKVQTRRPSLVDCHTG
ncbi:hypothetical protein FB567DRAFT_608664 [Paraphoma chrysanthemicola]|uniref:Rhodopsin domain-containing protein n=1 Tax=Paraphoma chrysanthemicola TaxID=798071 RepID=A0A8K0QWS1_9PLEO|nr:hypothetical protein FB567DRAFT_608664 [Paraphoma chrysanthemicola]